MELAAHSSKTSQLARRCDANLRLRSEALSNEVRWRDWGLGTAPPSQSHVVIACRDAGISSSIDTPSPSHFPLSNGVTTNPSLLDPPLRYGAHRPRLKQSLGCLWLSQLDPKHTATRWLTYHFWWRCWPCVVSSFDVPGAMPGLFLWEDYETQLKLLLGLTVASSSQIDLLQRVRQTSH